MTLMSPLLDEPIMFDENRIQVLIIENPPALRRVINELSAQAEGEPGDAVLAVDYVPCDFSKAAVLVTDPFHIDTASKRLLGKIQQAVVWAVEDHADTFHELLERINDLAASISLELDFSAAFDPLVNPEGLVRLLGFHMDNEGLPFPELLLEWMRIQRKLMGKRLFIFYGLKACLSNEEQTLLFRSILYEKLDVLLVEPFQRENVIKEECVTIIDHDLCVIR